MIVMPCVGRMRVSGACRWRSLRRAANRVGRAGALGAFLCALLLPPKAFAIGQERYVEFAPRTTSFVIARGETLANIYVDRNEWPGVVRAAKDLQADVERVTGRTPGLTQAEDGAGANAILVGTLGKSGVIDRLAQEGKLDVQVVKGKWESFVIQVVPQPLPGVASALVIAGSDKRGTIYGVYDLSEQIGVSPWYWWADVPVKRRSALYVKPGTYVQGPPAVKYRGIFLNDEAPALTGWVKEKFGDYNSKFYTKVFELILRLKGNYLWPAMWANAINEDDPLNPRLADEYGIVMGTSHHEPMLRAQQEWKRHGRGPWDYTTNAEVLRAFWDEGIRRNAAYESTVTLGMRGDGDLPMSQSANTALLERIVVDQRQILAKRMGPDISAVPQVWALYKEVQEYYEKGMRVPDDVTLLWCDDNWGNVRRLPTPEERRRSGGAGIYYHFDYVGGPRSYKWLNVTPIAQIWEQMSLAYDYGADRIWVVNVGDLKPMELPIEYFLNLAWDPHRWTADTTADFGRLWAEREFGPAQAGEIADIVAKYSKYNGRRKPEQLDPGTYSLVNYDEADTIAGDFTAISTKAEQISNLLPENARDAFFELVLHPAKACAQLAEMYVAAGKNKLYAEQGRASTNELAARTRALFRADQELSDFYNHTLAGGKWNHMMDQTHIGYTYWNQPRVNAMPSVQEIDVPAAGQMGAAIEGSTAAWPGGTEVPRLPELDSFNRGRRYIDVFNRGREAFEFTASASVPWIVLSPPSGTVEQVTRLWVSVDWRAAPKGLAEGEVTIVAPGAPSGVTVLVHASNPELPTRATLDGFVEADGYVAIEAEHYTRKLDTALARWEKIADYGRTLSSMAVFPDTAASVTPPHEAPCLEYRMYLFHGGKVKVDALIAPSLNFVPGRGLRAAFSFDDQAPQVVDALAGETLKTWERAVSDSIRTMHSEHTLAAAGYHTLKVWMVDPGAVLQKIVVDLGGVRPSYLGPPESYRGASRAPRAVRRK